MEWAFEPEIKSTYSNKMLHLTHPEFVDWESHLLQNQELRLLLKELLYIIILSPKLPDLGLCNHSTQLETKNGLIHDWLQLDQH